jgi:hypothetical protein
MRDETRRRLDRALLRQKLKWIALAVGAVAIGAGLIYLEDLDSRVTATHRLDGTVVYVGPLVGKYQAVVAEKNLQVDVRLADARVAHLLTPRAKVPKIGEHVTVAEHVHGTGRRTFGWQ